MSPKHLRKMRKQPTVKKTQQNLKLYDGSMMKTCGTCMLQCYGRKKRYDIEFIVIEEDRQPVLGAPTCLKENFLIVPEVKNLQHAGSLLSMEDIDAKYMDVFTGLGKIGDKCSIKLNENCAGVVNPSRRIPFAIKDKVKNKLIDLEKNGIIAKVTEPTEWVSNMVVTQKANGDPRICLDPKYLNEEIKRPHYMLQTIDEILPEL